MSWLFIDSFPGILIDFNCISKLQFRWHKNSLVVDYFQETQIYTTSIWWFKCFIWGEQQHLDVQLTLVRKSVWKYLKNNNLPYLGWLQMIVKIAKKMLMLVSRIHQLINQVGFSKNWFSFLHDCNCNHLPQCWKSPGTR